MVEDWRKRMWTQISDGVPVPHSLSCVEPFMVVGLEGDVIVTTGTWAGGARQWRVLWIGSLGALFGVL
ncbi:hypothetical protein S245_028374 [Arachis hypogaea]